MGRRHRHLRRRHEPELPALHRARPWDEENDFLQGKERELVGRQGDAVVYDALVDPELAIAVLHLVDPLQEVTVRRPLVLEHSNSSIVYDEALILKVFRKVAPGPNPDVEIPRALAAKGVDAVIAPVAELSRAGTDLGVLRPFLLGATEAWQIAQTSVRDLLASGLAPEECGGDFTPDAERLGVVVGLLHMGLAETFGVGPADPGEWVAEMRDRLGSVSRAAARKGPGGVEAAGPTGPGGLDTDAIEARYASLETIADPGTTITVHGDLHLAQVMRADTGWYVLDWEGEPMRRGSSRFTRSSPLRDVAGMLRSLHYVAATGLAEWGDESLAALTEAWEQRNRAAFLAGYLGTAGIDALLPRLGPDREAVLGCFELDKAVYEVGYELAHRPELARIPLSAVDRLLG